MEDLSAGYRVILYLLIIAVAAAIGADLVLQEGNVCPAEFRKLLSIEECRAISRVIPNIKSHYQQDIFLDNKPNGCILSKIDGGIFFNKHVNGKQNQNFRQICVRESTGFIPNGILFVGDSDIANWPTDLIPTSFPGTYNIGISGYTCKDVLDEAPDFISLLNPSEVVIICGENDLLEGTSVNVTQRHLRSAVNKYKESGAKVIYLGTKPEPSTKNLHAKYRSYDKKSKDYAEKNGFVMIDLYNSFEDLGNELDLYDSDKLHLSNLGYSNLKKWVEKVLSAKFNSCNVWQTGLCITGGISADPLLFNVYQEMSTPVTRAEWHIHDPSEIVTVNGGEQMLACTGKKNTDGYNCGIETWWRETATESWIAGQCLFRTKPSWVNTYVPTNDGTYWAPTLIDSNTMMYSVSGGFNDKNGKTCVGLATATGIAPYQTWTDQGVVECVEKSDFDVEVSALDPAVFTALDNSKYIVTGGGMIHIAKLESNLKPKSWYTPDSNDWSTIARGPKLGDDDYEWVEAAYILPDASSSFYFLFVNWGSCCSGSSYKYEIVMGRSTTPTGPFLDKNGNDMIDGGGSVMLATEDNMIGPGQLGVYTNENSEFVSSFHYYTKDNQGLPWVGEKVFTIANGWPTIDYTYPGNDNQNEDDVGYNDDLICKGIKIHQKGGKYKKLDVVHRKGAIYEALKFTSETPRRPSKNWEQVVATWSRNHDYQKDEYCIIGTKLYRSLQGSNMKNNPKNRKSWWKLVKRDVSTCSD